MILKREEGETLQDVVARHSDVVHLRVATVVCQALDEGSDRAHILTVLPDQYELFCTKSNYVDSLITNLPFVEEMEEYELCQRMHGWISKLKYGEYRDLIEKIENPEKPKRKRKKKDE
jgi:hypothetical protein